VTTRNSSRRLVSPVWLVLIGILSVQFGAGVAKSLFDEISPTSIVWLRLVTSAVVLVIGSRRLRDLLWILLAGLGVAVLGLEGGSDVNLAGVLYALLAGAMWASYILLAGQTGRRWPGFDGLALASVVATLLLTPLAIGEGGDDLLDPRILLLGAAVGVLSSVVPYTCELVALRSIKASVFSILMSLEPAAAALAGIVVLQEFLTWEQWIAMVCVVVASVGATRSARTLAPAPD